MKFKTEIDIPGYPFKIDYDSQMMLVGSCFSDHIGGLLERSKFIVTKNPLGIVFNPISIFNQFEYLFDENLFDQSDIIENDGIWHHFDFHGKFSGMDRGEVSESLKQKIEESRSAIQKAGILFITLGTSNVFIRKSSGRIVANNHKFPIGQFKKHRLSVDEICEAFLGVRKKLLLINPELKIVFTVSPVRYLREGLIENQRSKAILMLAIDALQDEDTIFYFPAYEIFHDVLRDYRFYAEDMTHPSKQGVQYVWDLFRENFFDDQTKVLQARIDRLLLSIEHRPIHPESLNHQKFRKQLFQDCTKLGLEYPGIDFSEELNLLR